MTSYETQEYNIFAGNQTYFAVSKQLEQAWGPRSLQVATGNRASHRGKRFAQLSQRKSILAILRNIAQII
jgi:hypothetical protein